MSLLSIPAELRLYIYALLPEFSQGSTSTASGRIPNLSQVCRVLREETLSVLVDNKTFAFELNDSSPVARRRFAAWLDALGQRHLSQIRSLQFSRHWELTQPTRGVGHFGFYIRIASVPATAGRECLPFQVYYGTYPFAKDRTALRYESVQLLGAIITEKLLSWKAGYPGQREYRRSGIGLQRADVKFIVAAVDALAQHPVSAYAWSGSNDVSQDTQARELAKIQTRLLTIA